MAQQHLNFKGVSALVVDRDAYYRALVAQMLRGFGIERITAAGTGAEAMALLKESHVDMCLFEADLPDMPGSDLIRWIRREQKDPLRFVPILVMSGYTQLRLLKATRDAGANILVKKPLSAQILFDRIAWLARTPRAYIETENYVGPDRKFREAEPPDGVHKRATDAEQARGIGA